MSIVRIAAGDQFAQEGVGMYIDYYPDSRGDPTVEKWCFTTNDPDSARHGDGRLVLTVREVVETQGCGTLVVYHRQWFAPDDEPLSRGRRVVSSLGALRGVISRRKMQTPSPKDTPDAR